MQHKKAYASMAEKAEESGNEEAAAKYKSKIEEIKNSSVANKSATEGQSQPTDASKITDEIDDSKMNYGREEVGAFFQRAKLAEEQAKLEATKTNQEEEAEAEKEAEKAAEAEKKREDKSQGKEIAGSSDGGKGSFKARRAAKKDAKKTAKEEKKAKIAFCKTAKGPTGCRRSGRGGRRARGARCGHRGRRGRLDPGRPGRGRPAPRPAAAATRRPGRGRPNAAPLVCQVLASRSSRLMRSASLTVGTIKMCHRLRLRSGWGAQSRH